MTNREKRKNLLRHAFGRVQGFIHLGYVVTWDGEAITKVNFDNGVELEHGEHCRTGVFEDSDEFDDMSCRTIPEINKYLKECLQIWKKVNIRL